MVVPIFNKKIISIIYNKFNLKLDENEFIISDKILWKKLKKGENDF